MASGQGSVRRNEEWPKKGPWPPSSLEQSRHSVTRDGCHTLQEKGRRRQEHGVLESRLDCLQDRPKELLKHFVKDFCLFHLIAMFLKDSNTSVGRAKLIKMGRIVLVGQKQI